MLKPTPIQSPATTVDPMTGSIGMANEAPILSKLSRSTRHGPLVPPTLAVANDIGDINDMHPFEQLASTSMIQAGTKTIRCMPPKNDGRICPACKNSDESPDPSSSTRTRIFGDGVRSPKAGKWIGRPCFYCYRVFRSRYKKEYGALEKRVAQLGVDKEMYDMTQDLLKELISKCAALGDADFEKFRMDWSAALERIKITKYKTERL